MKTKDQIYSHSQRDGNTNSQKNKETLNLKYKRKRRKANKIASSKRRINRK